MWQVKRNTAAKNQSVKVSDDMENRIGSACWYRGCDQKTHRGHLRMWSHAGNEQLDGPVAVIEDDDSLTVTTVDVDCVCFATQPPWPIASKEDRDARPERDPEYNISPVCVDCGKPAKLITTPGGARVCRDCYMGENYREKA